MRRGAPLRFLVASVGGWVALRLAMILPAAMPLSGAPVAARPLLAAAAPVTPPGAPTAAPLATGTAAAPAPAARRGPPHPRPRRASSGIGDADDPEREDGPGDLPAPRALPSAGVPAPAALPDATLAAVAPAAPHARRLSGSAWLFARGDGGGTLAPGGQLGGAQAGARVAWRVGERIALAGRLSTPLATTRGAEAAAGIDWLPFGARVLLRASLERRVALGRDARDAWSAYVAGGFYRAVGDAVVVDGYAQAGVVGARRRDLFADGAVRAGRRVALGPAVAVTLGAGLWGAAQPGAARLDLGPRAALGLPLGAASATLALEGRVRVAGRAHPGSGVALTLATDF